jgi:hypothetical protein
VPKSDPRNGWLSNVWLIKPITAAEITKTPMFRPGYQANEMKWIFHRYLSELIHQAKLPFRRISYLLIRIRSC